MKYKTVLLLISSFMCLYCGPEYKKHNFIWERRYDFNRESDRVDKVIVSKRGDLFVLGSSYKTTDEGDRKMYGILKKFSSKGKEDKKNWNKKIETDFFDADTNLTIDKNDNIYVAGRWYETLTDQRRRNWWVKKYSPNGKEDAEHWGNKIFWKDSYFRLSAIDVDNKNNLYVGGNDRVETEDVRDIGDEDGLWWIKKYNENGVEDTNNWDKRNDNGNNDVLYETKVDKKNNIYLSGGGRRTVAGKKEYYSWIRKYDENGVEDKNWDKRFSPNDNSIYWIIILIDLANNIYTVGMLNDNSDGETTLRIKKFSEDGIEDKNWDKKYFRNNSFNLEAAAIDKYNNIYVAGYGNNLVSAHSERDMWIRIIGFDGQEDLIKWDKKIDGKNLDDEAYGIAIDAFNDVYVVGRGTDLIAKMTEKGEEMLFDPNVPEEKKIEIEKRASYGDWWILKFRGER